MPPNEKRVLVEFVLRDLKPNDDAYAVHLITHFLKGKGVVAGNPTAGGEFYVYVKES